MPFFLLGSFLLSSYIGKSIFEKEYPLLVILIISLLFLIVLSFKKGGKIFAILSLTFASCGLTLPKIIVNEPLKQINGNGIVYKIGDDYFLWRNASGRYYVEENDHEQEIGNILYILGETTDLKMTHYENRFDFGKYLEEIGVLAELKPQKIEIKYRNVFGINKRVKEFANNFQEPGNTFIRFLLLGRAGTKLGTELKKMNLFYIMSSSGLLFSSVIHLLEKVFSYFFEENKIRKISILISIFLFPFFIAKVSYWRSLLTRIARIFYEKKYQKKLPMFTFLPLLAFSFLICDFSLLFQSGFFWTFALSFYFHLIGPWKRRGGTFKTRFGNFILRSLILLPLFLSFNGSFFFSLLKNLFLLPLSSFLFLFIIPFFLFSCPARGIFEPLFSFTHDFIRYFVSPFPEIIVWKTGLLILVSFILISGLYFYLIRCRYSFLCPSFIVIFLVISSIIQPSKYLSGEVIFLDVGQGDAILIRNKEKATLIDTGGSRYFDLASETLIPAFRKRGILSLESVIITHDDFDHSGALDSLCEHFPVKEVIRTIDGSYSSAGIEFYNLNPGNFENENDNSLVLYFSFLGRDFLLMGDAGFAVENMILEKYPDLECDVLKVGHHGSNTSSSYDFLKEIKPKEAVISVGENNFYQHPHKDVLENLMELEITIRRTDLEGSIVYRDFVI